MQIRPIKNEEDYNAALRKIDQLIDCKENSKEEDELEVISLLVWHYEEKHYRIESPEPVQAIKARMNALDLRPKDLVESIGDKSRVSQVLSKKRKLTLRMIHNLSRQLGIPVETLAQEY